MRRSTLVLALVSLLLSSGGGLAFDPARYGSPTYEAPNVERLPIQGKGSTGDASTLSATAPLAGAVSRTLADRLLDIFSAKDAGAKGDVVTTAAAVTIAAGSKTLTVDRDLFAAGDVGKKISVQNAGIVMSVGYVTGAALAGNGTNCTSIPVMTLSGGAGFGASVSPLMQARSVTVAAGGSGYTNGTQTLTVRVGYGTAVQISATVSGGAVTAVQAIGVAGPFGGMPSLSALPVTSGGGGTGARINVGAVDVVGVQLGSAGFDYPGSSTTMAITGGGCATAPTPGAVGVAQYYRPLGSTITAVAGPRQVTLADAAVTGLSGASMTLLYGTDDTAALNTAIGASRVVRLPPGRYFVCGISPTTGTSLVGEGGLGYGLGPGSASTNTILVATPGCAAGTTLVQVAGTNSVRLARLVVDCNVPGVGDLHGIGTGSALMALDGVTVQGCGIGVGGTSGVTGAAQARDVQLSNNRVGLQGLQDSVWTGGAMSANGTGLVLGVTQGGNRFLGVRIEHNIVYGADLFQTQYNQFVACTFDANYRGGLRQVSAYANKFPGTLFLRNGRNNDGDDYGDADIVDYRNHDIDYTGITADSFADDNGTGPLVPRYVFNRPEANDGIAITGGALRTGYTLALSKGVEPTAYVQTGIPGVPAINTASRPYIRNGVSAQMLRRPAAPVTPGATTTVPITQEPITDQYATYQRTLVVSAFDGGTNYRVASAVIPIVIPTGAASGTPVLGATTQEAGTTGVFGTSSGLLRLSASGMSADGSSWTLTIANAGSNDGSSWTVWVELR